MEDSPMYKRLEEPLMERQSGPNVSSSFMTIPELASPTTKKQLRALNKAYGINSAAFERYKRVLRKRVIWSFIVMFVVLMERIFASYMREDENALVVWLQKFAGITYEHGIDAWYFKPIIFLEDAQQLMLLVGHFFIFVYYLESAITSLKIMYIHLNALALVTLSQMLFGDPRPFWDDERIAAVACPNSFTFPSYSAFCILFLFLYSLHCIYVDEAEEDWTPGELIAIYLFIGVFAVFSFLKVLGGLDYLSQMFLASFYAILIYYPCVFFDKTITVLIEKSSINVASAKRYSIYWLVYLLMLGGASAMVFGISNDYLEINWYKNYVNFLFLL